MQQFADRTNAAVAEVVDIIRRTDAEIKVEIDGNGRDDILYRNVFVVKLVDNGP